MARSTTLNENCRRRDAPWLSFRRAAALILALVVTAVSAAPAAMAAPQSGPTIIVYFIDHQFLPPEEIATLQAEVNDIFESAGLSVEWVADDSPRRRLEPHELRLIILPSDGTRWFHGPSNVIGIAPHDSGGTGRNCFVFYRQAIWFRQQAVFRCREAIQARTEAAMRDIELDPFIDALAPADCGERLPSLTAMIVARAAAHEMVHILLNKLDHTSQGLMRSSFDISDWFIIEVDHFRLGANEVQALQELFGNTPAGQ